ncbi:hypothetical protein HWV62_14398 [Athelia sp. TMB]|nr:hypothetical protein HWV62_14398 [Athelia sp. TMB]
MDSHQVTLLRNSVNDCSERGLFIASKWSSELLLAVPLSKRRHVPVAHESTFSTSTPARARSPRPSLSFVDPSPVSGRGIPVTPSLQTAIPDLHVQSEAELIRETELEARDADSLATARACINAREFLRAVHILKDRQSAKARFVSLYSQFLSTEKKALQDWHKLDNKRHQPPVPTNTSLLELLEQVKNATNPWLLFLKALFLCGLKRREEAIESALLSISGYPWNWSTWTLLGSCIGDGEELSSLLPLLPLPANHPLVQMFQVKTLNELHNPSENELAICDGLLGDDYFPNSLWAMSLRACVLYHLHDFGNAELQFEKILQLDPYRIDDIDVFSNILYVTDNKLKLSRLAHEFLALDKDRPERFMSNPAGNHYSLRAEHEKAVKYFRRATQLDHTYLSAWTLMGHEYVEMKNSHAAIEAYRRAVDVNRKDYRAWYGLGQAYELLNMHQYALHYYQHATALRPYDVRLWQAQGMCYEEIGRLREAIECLKRALIGADPNETSINVKLAKLHHDLEEFSEAAAYHRRVVEVCRANGRPVPDFAKSSLYVARHYLTTGGDLHIAHEYLERVAASNSEEVGQATELLKQAKNMISTDAGVRAKVQNDTIPIQ